MKRTLTVLRKELMDIRRNRSIWLSTLALSLAFLFFPFVVGLGIPALMPETIERDQDMGQALRTLRDTFGVSLELSSTETFQFFVFRQFSAMLLLIPLMAALTIATYSVIGEKQARSLEPLLATPLTALELLTGKALAAAVPALLATWGVFAMFVVMLISSTSFDVVRALLDASTLAMMALLVPLIAVLGLSLGVVVSSRVNDPRTAQQIGGLVVIPLVVVVVGQSTGLLVVGLSAVLNAAAVLAVLDMAILTIGALLFDRERVLTSWR
jgi:ABC-2 type transport system permease protein